VDRPGLKLVVGGILTNHKTNITTVGGMLFLLLETSFARHSANLNQLQKLIYGNY
jgi:hypothetical protein